MGWLRALLCLGFSLPAIGCAARQTPAGVEPFQDGATADDAALQAKVAALDADERARLQRYVAAIEERAARRNTEVLWVNPPNGAVISDAARLRQMIERLPPTH